MVEPDRQTATLICRVTPESGFEARIDALLAEVARLLEQAAASGEGGLIDVWHLALSAPALAQLEQRLGVGEILITLSSQGESRFRETAFAGVWWCEHRDQEGRLRACLIEVAAIPAWVPARADEMAAAARHLQATAGAAESPA